MRLACTNDAKIADSFEMLPINQNALGAASEVATQANGWEVVAQSGRVDPLERPQCCLALTMANGLSCPVVVHRFDHDLPTSSPCKSTIHPQQWSTTEYQNPSG